MPLPTIAPLIESAAAGVHLTPDGTTMETYADSIQKTILDPYSGVATSLYQGMRQLTVVGRSGSWQGPNGFGWILVDYRQATGHWMTAYQPEEELNELRSPRREELRWLRLPR